MTMHPEVHADTKMTTAQYREKARAYEAQADWKMAACMWDLAIDAYPNIKGDLAARDLANMKRRRDSAVSTNLAR